MSRRVKLLSRVLRGTNDANIDFDEMCQLLGWLGFEARVRGSHRIFTREDLPEIINLQPRGSSAKPYQDKQVRDLVIRYQLTGGDVDD